MCAESEDNQIIKMSGVNLEKKTVVELKSMLMARNLETSGRKTELIARLESAVTPDTVAVDPVGSQVVRAATIGAREDPPEWAKALQRQMEAVAGTAREPRHDPVAKFSKPWATGPGGGNRIHQKRVWQN